VYALRDRGHDNLYALTVGQKAPVRLTNTPADDQSPAWSPDGTKIAFASHRDGNWELYVMDVASGNTSRLTYDLAYESAPTWSPDGKFIAYEGYQNNNLDIYIVASDGSGNPIRLTQNPAPDYSPAWSPDGRHIAYVSLREGSAQVYVIDLNSPIEDKALRLTSEQDVDAQSPVWSPNGSQIAYSARVNGLDEVFTKTVAQPNADPVVVGQGRDPAWSPNGASLIFAVDSITASGATSTLISGQVGNFGVSALAYTLKGRVSHPSWTGNNTSIPAAMQQNGGVKPLDDKPLYTEVIHYQADKPPYFKLAQLSGVTAPNPYLSDKVDDSFVALRAAIVQRAGFDFLGNLQDALWAQDRPPEPGQSRQSWHYGGRAFDFDKNLVFGSPSPIEVVREDSGVNTLWRVYIRVPEELQGGQLGEPLKRLPWDFASRSSGDPQTFENGGRTKASVPAGYYVDFTEIAQDYAWMPVPSGRDWRRNYSSILYWEFDKNEGLSWTEAMLQLYSQDDLNAFLNGPTPLPVPIAASTATPDRGPTRTPTPIPPDAKSGH
ncbi:MAG TPA: DPP IV N-terminal domain-containing protein, partial [Aggregatilineales bacterium]|nr:DPP IV N-terminal domain-containing protein [Aggregatilineales bacterium]